MAGIPSKVDEFLAEYHATHHEDFFNVPFDRCVECKEFRLTAHESPSFVLWMSAYRKGLERGFQIVETGVPRDEVARELGLDSGVVGVPRGRRSSSFVQSNNVGGVGMVGSGQVQGSGQPGQQVLPPSLQGVQPMQPQYVQQPQPQQVPPVQYPQYPQQPQYVAQPQQVQPQQVQQSQSQPQLPDLTLPASEVIELYKAVCFIRDNAAAVASFLESKYPK